LALRRRAREEGRTTAEYLRLYVLEGFLLRLANSPHKGKCRGHIIRLLKLADQALRDQSAGSAGVPWLAGIAGRLGTRGKPSAPGSKVNGTPIEERGARRQIKLAVWASLQ
jgi:hypothetical protein